ncbi:MAG: dTDP-4-dehydrorhamnose 3,5-epimerase [candidate division Zixibacteria bacterium RBG_16_50_21]|nr:MAG: dTDP-4-dehydrorhamnose 3,5-epimerase [candidate division Zixibacteria bacterium RBG_16_50_21]
MIEGVKIKKLKVIPDERGRLMEIMRSDDEFFSKFGQLYLTSAYPGAVKAWHYHKKQTDNFCVVKGMMKIVIYDERENSPTKGEVNEFFIGEHNPCILQIPRLLWHGFKCISDTEAICLNCPTEVYNYQEPDEFRADPHKSHIPYDWSRKDG